MSNKPFICLLSANCSVVGFFIATWSISASAVEKCVSPSGQVTYQSEPCSRATVADDLSQARQKLMEAREKKTAAALLEAERKEALRKNQEPRNARIDAAPLSALSPIELAERKSREAERLSAEVSRKWSDETTSKEWKANLKKYCNGKVMEPLVIGMTENQMFHCSSYRLPDSINETRTAAGTTN